MRIAIATEWQRLKHTTSQADFIALVRAKYGISLSARTLRAWSRDIDHPDAHHLAQLRRLLSDTLHRVRRIEAEVHALLGSLPADAAAEAAPPLSRHPHQEAAATHDVDSTHSPVSAAVGNHTIPPASPTSTDALGSTCGNKENRKTRFDWVSEGE